MYWFTICWRVLESQVRKKYSPVHFLKNQIFKEFLELLAQGTTFSDVMVHFLRSHLANQTKKLCSGFLHLEMNWLLSWFAGVGELWRAKILLCVTFLARKSWSGCEAGNVRCGKLLTVGERDVDKEMGHGAQKWAGSWQRLKIRTSAIKENYLLQKRIKMSLWTQK